LLTYLFFFFFSDRHIHILGSFQNIKLARDAIVSLILGTLTPSFLASPMLTKSLPLKTGSPPGKVYGHLRSVASRLHERF